MSKNNSEHSKCVSGRLSPIYPTSVFSGPASTIPLTHTGIPQKEEPGHRVLSLLLLLLLLSLWQSPPVAAPSVIVAMEMNINAGRILAVDSAEHRESRIVDRGLRSAEDRTPKSFAHKGSVRTLHSINIYQPEFGVAVDTGTHPLYTSVHWGRTAYFAYPLSFAYSISISE